MSEETKELKIGNKAPNFTFEIAEGKQVSLKDYAGKFIVLYFYPKDNTPGCTIEANDFNRLLPEFVKLGTEVIGVSRDDLKSHDKFRSKYDLNFSLGSDASGDTCNQYGTWVQKSFLGKKYMGINRSTFLIDKKGKIAKIWNDVSVRNHAQDVLSAIKELKN